MRVCVVVAKGSPTVVMVTRKTRSGTPHPDPARQVFPVRRHDDGCAKILVRHAPHHFTTPEPYNYADYDKNIAWFLSEGQQSIPGQSTLKQLPCNSTEGRAPSGSRGIIPRWRSTHKLKSIVAVGTQREALCCAQSPSVVLG